MMANKPDCLLLTSLRATPTARLNAEFNVLVAPTTPAERMAFIKAHPDTRFVAASGGWVPAEVFQALPKLEIVSCFGVGYDGVDIAAAKAAKVPVTNTPDVLNDCVADTTMGMVLGAMRKFPQADRFVRDGSWLKGGQALTTSVHHKKMGIAGLGRIGKTIAKRAQGFDMEIAYYGRSKQADVPFKYFADIADMAAWCDVLVVITPGGAATRNMIDARVLKALGPKGYLVNISRGSVVDEPALIEALKTGAIAGAGLDVFADEPRVPEALLALDNVALAPHVGSATNETRDAMGNLVVDNLVAVKNGQKPLTPVY
ncbi:MAG: 2-hydroxyacid dehydrogenase [Alphaproteobacteria bacterium]|nr:2-hydroxyacid dehydrogenase [Alphaproteobacteria bacterium]MBN9497026.1 2-hydroxyacid dehydrogenase [Alphaproteobacteria bacterium]